jgi:hypothetical protein
METDQSFTLDGSYTQEEMTELLKQGKARQVIKSCFRSLAALHEKIGEIPKGDPRRRAWLELHYATIALEEFLFQGQGSEKAALNTVSLLQLDPILLDFEASSEAEEKKIQELVCSVRGNLVKDAALESKEKASKAENMAEPSGKKKTHTLLRDRRRSNPLYDSRSEIEKREDCIFQKKISSAREAFDKKLFQLTAMQIELEKMRTLAKETAERMVKQRDVTAFFGDKNESAHVRMMARVIEPAVRLELCMGWQALRISLFETKTAETWCFPKRMLTLKSLLNEGNERQLGQGSGPTQENNTALEVMKYKNLYAKSLLKKAKKDLKRHEERALELAERTANSLRVEREELFRMIPGDDGFLRESMAMLIRKHKELLMPMRRFIPFIASELMTNTWGVQMMRARALENAISPEPKSEAEAA